MQQETNKPGVLRFTAAAIVIAALFVSAQASATLINFESAGYLGDNAPIPPTLVFPIGDTGANVTFVGGSNPDDPNDTGIYLERTGNGDSGANGFLNTHNGSGKNQVADHDTARPCFPTGCANHPYPAGEPGLGQWFLRTDGLGRNTLGNGDTFLTILYGIPTLAASGQIWDIDKDGNGFEQWMVYAWNGDDTTPVALDKSPKGISQGNAKSLDGLPWDFSLSPGGGQTFDRITIVFIGNKNPVSDIGLAFDNFNATQAYIGVPEPSALWLFTLGLGMLGGALVIRRRKSHV